MPVSIIAFTIVLLISCFHTPIKSNWLFDYVDWYSELLEGDI